MKNFKIILLIFGSFLTFGCSLSYDNIEFKRGEHFFHSRQYGKALSFYKRIVDRNKVEELIVRSSKRILHINSLGNNDTDLAIKVLKILYSYEKDIQKKHQFLSRIRDIFFLEKQNYEKVILLTSYILRHKESYAERKKLILSYMYLGKYKQALIEIQETQNKNILNKKENFELENLKAQIYQNFKRYDAIEKVYLRLLLRYPQLSKEYQIPLSLSLFYQERGNFKKSIEVLKNHANLEDSFYQKRLQRLEILKINQPKTYRRSRR